jgi:hypothetical protein
MKKNIFFLAGVIMLVASCDKKQELFLLGEKNQIQNYAQACYSYSVSIESPLPDQYQAFYRLVLAGDLNAAQRIFEKIANKKVLIFPEGQRDVIARLYTPAHEIYWLLNTLDGWPCDLRKVYQAQVFDQLPENTVVFSGMAAGRFLIPYALGDKKNIIVISSNAIADLNYLRFITFLYGDKIWLPKEEDFARISKTLKNREGMQMVVEMNSRLCEEIFHKNLNYNFYLEEGFSMEWARSYEVPAGLFITLLRDQKDSGEFIKESMLFWREEVKKLGKFPKYYESTDVTSYYSRLCHIQAEFFSGKREMGKAEEMEQYEKCFSQAK